MNFAGCAAVAADADGFADAMREAGEAGSDQDAAKDY